MMLESLTTILFKKGFQKQSDYNFYILCIIKIFWNKKKYCEVQLFKNKH